MILPRHVGRPLGCRDTPSDAVDACVIQFLDVNFGEVHLAREREEKRLTGHDGDLR